MNIRLFLNKTGIIYGDDNKRIECDQDGILTIGNTDILVKANEENVLPLLSYGATGDFAATYKTAEETYKLGKVEVRHGRIISPPSHVIQVMELTSRVEVAEAEIARMNEKVEHLSHLFDTNALNFIIKGDEL